MVEGKLAYIMASTAGASLLKRGTLTVQLIAFRTLQTSCAVLRKLDTRAYPPYPFPTPKKGRWVEKKKVTELYDYTTEPVSIPKNDGRGPNGRIWNHRRGGGFRFPYHMIDWCRTGPVSGDAPLVEQVKEIKKCNWRTANIALVASGEYKRYIIATQNMKVGDLIKSSKELSRTAVRCNEGDAYPLGSLPIGTLVNSIQPFADEPSRLSCAAGVSSVIVRKLHESNQVVVRLPSKREICVSENCIGTVGRVSNIDHNKEIVGKAGANRWKGIRPKSGRWHRKDGRYGRKIKGVKKMKLYDVKPRKKSKSEPMTFKANVIQ